MKKTKNFSWGPKSSLSLIFLTASKKLFLLSLLIFSTLYLSISIFDFNEKYLPKELIAQTPLKNRSASKMMTLDKETGKYEDKCFTDLIDYLNEGTKQVLIIIHFL